jgi:SPP1 family predicted phage head-tail adaptor
MGAVMYAGRLRHRVTIERRGTAVDAIGQPVETWSPYATVWADVRHQQGLEAIHAGAPTSVARASIRIRYREDIDHSMRVSYKGKTYNIIAVLPGSPEHVDLVCEVVG